MDPEQRLLIVMEYLPVKFNIIVLLAFAGILRPQRMDVVHEDGTLLNFQADRLGLLLFLFAFLSILLFFLLFLLLRLNGLQHHVRIQLLILVDGLGLRRVLSGQPDLYRHEGAVFLNDLFRLILVAELQAVLIQKQRNLRSHLIPGAVRHGKFRAAVAFPVNRNRALLIGKGIDVHLVRHHERGIKAQTEMADDLIVVGLVLIFLNEISRAGKGDLVDVFLHLVRRHAESVIDKL